MFGKKILSIVGLVFLGSQLASVNAGCTPTYDATTSGCEPSGCGNDDIGNLILVESSDSKKYVVKISKEAGSSDDVDEYGVLKCNLETEINGDVCVSEQNIISENLKNAFCNDGACANYMTCKSGECVAAEIKTIRTETPKCDPSNDGLKDNCEKGYHVMSVDTEEGGSPVYSLIINDEEGTVLYYCDGNGSCNERQIPIGYLINGNKYNKEVLQYLECNKTSCKAIAAESGNCNGKSAGDIVKIGGVANICISDEIAIPLTSPAEERTEPIKYFVKHDSTAVASNVFQGNVDVVGDGRLDLLHFMVEISASGTDVTLPETAEGPTGIKYRYTDGNQRIYESVTSATEGGICDNGVAQFSMVEYVKDYKAGDKVDYYLDERIKRSNPNLKQN